MKRVMTMVAAGLLSTVAQAGDQNIRCTVTTKAGTFLASETSSLGRGVDLTSERGVDFYAYLDGRTDKRVFRVEAFDTSSGDLMTARTVSYYKETRANLTLDAADLVFSCEMNR